MKRIDDKIKEIEKNDKKNRILYYVIVGLIIAFLAFASTTRKTIEAQGKQINEQGLTIDEQHKKIEKQNDSLKDVVERLSKSQTPIGFWTQTLEAKNASSYLNYIVHQGKPEPKDEYREKAIENIPMAETEGKTVWLFAGRKSGDVINRDKVFEIVYRLGEEFESNGLPIVGDVVENVTMNRNTYRNYSNGNTSGPNNANKAWNRNSKALILDVEYAGDAVFINIKF